MKVSKENEDNKEKNRSKDGKDSLTIKCDAMKSEYILHERISSNVINSCDQR